MIVHGLSGFLRYNNYKMTTCEKYIVETKENEFLKFDTLKIL